MTYPACHYTGETENHELVEKLCSALKRSGFRYVIVVSARLRNLAPPSADLTFVPNKEGVSAKAEAIGQAIRSLWAPPVNA
ncbi:hypothetical protein D3C84_1214750 [compost metagenome]